MDEASSEGSDGQGERERGGGLSPARQRGAQTAMKSWSQGRPVKWDHSLAGSGEFLHPFLTRLRLRPTRHGTMVFDT
jgi:hypothetical protein